MTLMQETGGKSTWTAYKQNVALEGRELNLPKENRLFPLHSKSAQGLGEDRGGNGTGSSEAPKIREDDCGPGSHVPSGDSFNL